MRLYILLECLLLVPAITCSGLTLRVSESTLKTPDSFNLVLSRYVSGETVTLDTLFGLRAHEERTVELGNDSEGLFFLQVAGEANQGEFIWSERDDDLVIESDYWSFKNGQLGILNSEENAAYAQLLALKHSFEIEFERRQSLFGLVNPFQKDFHQRMAHMEDSIAIGISLFNSRLKSIGLEYESTFTGRVLVPLNLLPEPKDPKFRSEYDGFLSLMNEQYFVSCDFSDRSVLNHYALEDKVISYLDKYTQKSSDGAQKGIDVIMEAVKDFSEVRSFVYNLLLKNFLAFKTETLARYLMDHYADGCALSLSVQDMKRLVDMQSLMEGGTLPNLNLLDADSRPHELHKYASENRFTIVYIWISWCAKCQIQGPEIARLYQSFGKKGLGVYSISLDEKREDWIEAKEKFNAKHPNVCELVSIKNSSVAPRYGVSTTPKIFIIDSESTIVAKDVYADDLERKISALFAK
jgi:peroxiredoxin